LSFISQTFAVLVGEIAGTEALLSSSARYIQHYVVVRELIDLALYVLLCCGPVNVYYNQLTAAMVCWLMSGAVSHLSYFFSTSSISRSVSCSGFSFSDRTV